MITIKVLIITDDNEYCHRLGVYFAKHHPEIKFTFASSAQGTSDRLANKAFNVALIGGEFSNTQINIPGSVAGAYLTEDSSESEINGLRSFCKYKSGEMLYRTILSMFSEVSNVQQLNPRESKIFAFISANGGAGATTAAAAFAYRQASNGKKTLYFCCDQFADYKTIMSDNTEGKTLSDLIFIVKSSSSSGSASLKAAAMLKRDVSGVRFIENCADPSDFDSLSQEQIEKMLDIVSCADEFDCIVIDSNFNDQRLRQLVLKKADVLFIVSENGVNAAAKLSKLTQYLKLKDMRDGTDICSRSIIIINKDTERGRTTERSDGFVCCGEIPKYKDNNVRNIANAASRLDIWHNVGGVRL